MPEKGIGTSEGNSQAGSRHPVLENIKQIMSIKIFLLIDLFIIFSYLLFKNPVNKSLKSLCDLLTSKLFLSFIFFQVGFIAARIVARGVNSNERLEKIGENDELNFQQKIVEELKRRKVLQLFMLLFPGLIFLFQVLNSEYEWLSNHQIIISIIGATTTIVVLYLALLVINEQQVYITRRLESIETHARNILLRNIDSYEKIGIQISNMYNFLIHAPVLFCDYFGYFRREFLQVNYHNAGSDIEAIRSILGGHGIAITDPFFITQLANNNLSSYEREQLNDLVILAPILFRPAIWVIENNNNNNNNNIYFVYDQNSSSWILGRYWLQNVLGQNNIYQYQLLTLADIYNSGNNYSYIEFLRDISRNDIGNSNIIDRLLECRYLFLTEPDATIITHNYNNIFNNIGRIDRIGRSDNNDYNYVFTALITTRTFIRNNPVVLLKFLRALKLGFLKIQEENINFQNILYLTAAREDNILYTLLRRNLFQEESLLQNLRQNLQDLYPRDLILFYNCDEEPNNSELLRETFFYYDNENLQINNEMYILNLNNLSNIDHGLMESFNFIRNRVEHFTEQTYNNFYNLRQNVTRNIQGNTIFYNYFGYGYYSDNNL